MLYSKEDIAQYHKIIAANVWPNSRPVLRGDMSMFCFVYREPRIYSSWFDLLEADQNKKSTDKAKADTLDVICWLAKIIPSEQICNVLVAEGNLCENVFKLACDTIETWKKLEDNESNNS